MTTGPVLELVARADQRKIRAGKARREIFAVIDLRALGAGVDAMRPSLAVMFVLDTSGSMKGEPLHQVQTSVEKLAGLLSPEDEVGVVAFASQPVVAVPPAPLTSTHRQVISRRVRGLLANGQTGMRAGIEAGAKSFGPRREHQRQVMLLLTDGEPTDGSTAQSLAEAVRVFRPDVSTTTLGYGPAHNAALLDSIAQGGGGQYWYVPDPSSADMEFARALGAQGDIVVDGVELVLTPAENVEIVEVLDGTKPRFSSQGLVLPRPDLRADQRHCTVVRMTIDVDREPGRVVPLKVSARHRRAGEQNVQVLEAEIALQVGLGDDEADHDAHRQVVLAQSERQRAVARGHADQGRYDAAAAVLRPLIARLEALPGYKKLDGSDLSEAVEQLIDEVMAYEQRPSAQQYLEFKSANMGVDLAQGARHRADVKASSEKSKALTMGMLDASAQGLVIVSQDGKAPEVLPLQPEMTIGRVMGNDIMIASGNLSKRHARLVCKDGQVIVVDLKSTNGTFVDGVRVSSPMVLPAGGKIQIGNVSIEVVRKDKP